MCRPLGAKESIEGRGLGPVTEPLPVPVPVPVPVLHEAEDECEPVEGEVRSAELEWEVMMIGVGSVVGGTSRLGLPW